MAKPHATPIVTTALLDIPPGVNAALGLALANIRNYGYACFLDGSPKALVVLWCGEGADLSSFDPERGDGLHFISQPGGRLFQYPPGTYDERHCYAWEEIPSSWAFRIAVPCWVLMAPPAGRGLECLYRESSFTRHRQHQVRVLGCGVFHPRLLSFTLDIYHPETQQWQCRRVRCNPDRRLSISEIDDLVNEIKAMGAIPAAADPIAPTWRFNRQSAGSDVPF